MNKKSKRLILAKETLKSLQEEPLKEVHGGDTRPLCWTGYNSCATCGATCGTNLC